MQLREDCDTDLIVGYGDVICHLFMSHFLH